MFSGLYVLAIGVLVFSRPIVLGKSAGRIELNEKSNSDFGFAGSETILPCFRVGGAVVNVCANAASPENFLQFE